MASEESMSMCSTSSGMTNEYAQAEGFSKLETVGFSFFSPLYHQPKHPSKTWEIFVWAFTVLQMVTLSFFRVDVSTQKVNTVSLCVGFPDGTSLGYLAGNYVSFVIIGCAGYLALLIIYIAVTAIFQGVISGSQPWVISLLRWLVNFTYTILFIPLTSICITIFDCYKSEGQMVHRGFEGSCSGSLLSFLGFIVSMLVLIVLLISSILINNMIFNHNSKHGGLWSSPSGLWQAVDSSLVFGCVFAMRTLIEWPFWRGVVTVGSSLAMMVYFVYIQPIYKLNGNLLMGSKWCMFGCLRLIDEILYAIEGATGNWIITIVLQVVGLIAGIVVCAVLLPKIGRKMREKKYLLTAFGNQLSDICTKNPSLALPPLKKPERVEPSLRFIQQKEYNSMIHLTFADYVYTHALKTNPNNSMLCFQYATFLSAYRKNYMKSNTLIQKARSLSPGMFLNFVLFCKAKENGGRANGQNGGNGAGNMNSFAFTTLLAKAEKHHEQAVSAMKDFFENATAMQPDYKAIPGLLNSIVKNEDVARKSYEELIASHEQNTGVLRSYARLLLDIYDDEDEAEMILNRAEQIEEDYGYGESMAHTHAGGFHDGSFGMGEAYEMSGRRSAGGDRTGAEHEANMPRIVRRGSFEVNAGSVKDGANGDKGAEGSSLEAQNLDGERESLARSEAQWQQSSSGARRHHTSNRRRRKKKKKESTIVDLVMGGHGEHGNKEGNIFKLKFTVIVSHMIDIAVLIAALIVYVIMTNNHQKNLQTLRNVCDLSFHSARSATIGYNFFIYDKRYNFTNPTSSDKWPAGMIQKKDLLKMMDDTSESLASMLGRIHQSTTNLEVWETADVSTYFFTMTTKEEEQDGETTEVIDTKRQVLRSSSMLEVLATVSQITHHLYLSNISSRPQDPDYLSNIQFLVFNCPVPILEGAKRVIIYYFDLMNTECNQIIIVFSVIISAFLLPLTIFQLFLFVRFSHKAVKNRMRAYQTMLDMPKNKMQSVIRRLLRDEDEEDDFTINIEMGESMETRTYDNYLDNNEMHNGDNNHNGEFLEDPGASALQEGGGESGQGDSQSKIVCNSLQTSHLNGKGLGEINARSMFVRQASMDSQQKRKSSFKQNSPEMELSYVKSASSMLSGAGPSMDSIHDTPFSLSSSSSLFEEHLTTIPSTSGLQLQMPTVSEESTKGAQTNEQGNGARRKSHPLLTNIDTSLNNQKAESEGSGAESQSSRSKNDLTPPEHIPFSTNEVAMVEHEGASVVANATPTGNAPKTVINPMFGGNVLAAPQTTKPLGINQFDELNNMSQTPLLMPQLFSNNGTGGLNNNGNNNQPHFGLTSTASFSIQHTMSEYETGSIFNSTQIMPPLSPTNVYQQKNPMLFSQNLSLQQIDVPAPMPTVSEAQLRTDRNMLDANEPIVQAQQQQQPQEQQQQQIGAVDMKYTYDDEDNEEIERARQMGMIRNAVEDAAWEEQMEKDIEKHEAAYKQLPKPVTAKIRVPIFLFVILGLCAVFVTVILTITYVAGFKPISANIILSGMRASILFQIQFLLISVLQPLPLLKTDQSITFPRANNPVMHNSSHCSGDPLIARNMLVSMSNYFDAVHLGCHFGDSEYSHADDVTYDAVTVSRMKTEFNVKTLLADTECFLAESDDCSQVDPMRIYGVHGNLYGLTSLLARMRINVERISKMDVENITYLTPEARFILNGLRNDIVGGINKMTNMILTEGKEEVQESVTILIAVIVVFCVLYLVSMFGNGLMWIGEIAFIENASEKLLDLLPIKEGEKEIVMMPSMVTGHDSFDKGREAILDYAQQLITSINQNEPYESLVATFFQLSSTAFAVFNEEEREMAAKNYEGIERHKREHLLLRQRLTMIADLLRSKNDAAKAVGKRKLVSLFDMHFTDEDINFADTCFGMDDNNQNNNENDNDNNDDL
ncbi:uncharacterized protein MONOS_15451 [Monocercomonoides exilis]|uniref:uncharacterized protein n=1 Tax=Monocercomonoides exilis TaxID=2049356 RepID=UPI00355A539C|nr:hypothetical protein MONOS_15451 [Monocercomonoides exilis]|eukprot:MONOS_15451.1-p1 / transcript=MONOS_15451.1 / gene=MONOS_15451 / organism=Monocercomonoides_exilis_PA203 / gene_product=unspecified product / transcript_product=unspecified product / location=Mono_scaffold01236:6588-12448(-) / protein_length=1915 / sequence_SO=supercontig / SO=protein_coding / is_pseudo=false